MAVDVAVLAAVVVEAVVVAVAAEVVAVAAVAAVGHAGKSIIRSILLDHN
jgi:hypothetical protein